MVSPASRTTALIVAHGQPSDPEPAETALAALAAEVQALLPDWSIRSATLASPGQLEARQCDGMVVYPFFMAEGWFSRQVLPRRLASARYHMARPFGLSPDLPPLVAGAIRTAINSAGWEAADCDVLLAAHGSARGPKAAEATYRFIRRLSPLLPLVRLSACFVEQRPSVTEAARLLSDTALCLPFFAQTGDHVREDVMSGLDAGGFTGLRLPSAGALPGVAQLIANDLIRDQGKIG